MEKKYKDFLSILHINTSNCECCKTNSNIIKKWCVNTTNRFISEDFEMFIKEKPSYTQKNC